MNRHTTMLLYLLLLGAAAAAVLSPAGRAETLPQAEFTQGVRGAHDMKGTVTEIDHRSGLVRLSAGALDLLLHFPPPTLVDVEPGDTLIVSLGIKEIRQNPAATN